MKPKPQIILETDEMRLQRIVEERFTDQRINLIKQEKTK